MSKMRDKYESGDVITWLQVHNLLPIIGVIVSALAVWQSLDKKVDLQNRDISTVESSMKNCQERLGIMESSINALNITVAEIQARGSVKGVSTRMETAPTPVPTAHP